jgi:hypothetical protein
MTKMNKKQTDEERILGKAPEDVAPKAVSKDDVFGHNRIYEIRKDGGIACHYTGFQIYQIISPESKRKLLDGESQVTDKEYTIRFLKQQEG